MAVGLVRYGSIPEVARFEIGSVDGLQRGSDVVIETHRGLQLGTFLERVRSVHPADRDPLQTDSTNAEETHTRPILRRATEDDLKSVTELKRGERAAFDEWVDRISQWSLELELIDLEWTLDGQKLILYVLNERGPDCTKLALQAAAAGLGTVEVQPVAAEGLVTQPAAGGGGGCGSCGHG